MPATDSDTLPSAVEHPAISSSVTMPISLYRLNDRMVGDTVRTTKVTEYPYLFQKRTELTGTFREAATLPDYYHARMFSHLGKRWRLIAQTFHPWDDEHTLTLQHSPTLSACTVTTNFDNVSAVLPGTLNYGSSLSVTLSGVGDNRVQQNSVVVMMGGIDVTRTTYNHSTKTITIANVTGGISITAVGRPYDAEVEYLQSSGTQYIDTGIYGNKDVDYEVTAQIVGTQNFQNILGDRYSSSSKRYTLMIDAKSTSYSAYFNCGNENQIYASASYRSSNYVTYKKTGLDVYIGASKIGTFFSQTFTTQNTIILFGARNNGTLSSPFYGKILSAKFYNEGVLARDYIPVRDNNVGYLYDKVSGQLFGNASGSGAFTYGNDVTT